MSNNDMSIRALCLCKLITAGIDNFRICCAHIQKFIIISLGLIDISNNGHSSSIGADV